MGRTTRKLRNPFVDVVVDVVEISMTVHVDDYAYDDESARPNNFDVTLQRDHLG